MVSSKAGGTGTGRVYESERMPENNAVLNPEPEVAEKQSGYCLTAEDGMLLIFDGASGEVCFRPICRSQNFPWKNRKTAGRSLVRHNDGCVSLSGVFQQLDDYNTVKKQRIKSAYERYEANGQEGK